MNAHSNPVPHLLHVFSTFGVGGQQMRFVTLANALAGKFRHTILAMDGDLAAGAGLGPNAACDYASMPVVKSSSISFANIRAGHDLLRKLRPDLLISYNWGTIEWSLTNWPQALCPHLHIEDGFGPGESPQRQNRRRVLTRRILLRRCALTLVPSRTLNDVALQVWKLPPKRVRYVPNGIDCARFACEPDQNLLRQFGLESDVPVVGTVATLRAEKNLTRLLRVFARLPAAIGAKLLIIGEGPERARIEAASAQLGIGNRVILTGAMAEPEKLLKRIDVFALTSDTEQMPNSVLEAMAAGRALVSTDVGDVKQMLSKENRDFVYPLEEEARHAEGVRALLLDRALRLRIGESNADRARTHYDLDTMVKRYEALFGGPF